MSKRLIHATVLERQRWNEIRFKAFCVGLYQNRKNTMDMADTVEVLALCAGISGLQLRNLSIKMMTDVRFDGSTRETTYLTRQMGYSLTDIAKIVGVSRRHVPRIMAELEKTPVYCFPRLDKSDTIVVDRFMSHIDYLRRCIL